MKRIKIDLGSAFEELARNKVAFRMEKTTAENLDLDHGALLPAAVADELMRQLEDGGVEYYEGELTKVKVFGKWHEIPRQQVAYGDDGTTYSFSGTSLPAKPWTPVLSDLRNLLLEVTGFRYNFVLVNRYRNGKDHIGEHKDGEKELDKNAPIASLSLGQERTFIVKHGDSRKKGPAKRDIPTGRETDLEKPVATRPRDRLNWGQSVISLDGPKF